MNKPVKQEPLLIKHGRQAMLIVDGDDPEAELEFEVQFQLSLTAEQRYEAMDQLVKAGMEMIAQHGHSTTPRIVTRS